MRLVGMLDSPYVRRVAVSMQLLGLRFEHQPLSVFSTFEQFRDINPVVKAPTLIVEDGSVLMDSSLILQYAEHLACPRTLMPTGAGLPLALRIIGLSLAVCEKSVQIVYERNLRPPEKLHEPWIRRVTSQLIGGFDALEVEMARRSLAVTSASITQVEVSAAVAWNFTQQVLPEVIPASRHPVLGRLSAMAEALPEFAAAPHGDSTYSHSHYCAINAASESEYSHPT